MSVPHFVGLDQERVLAFLSEAQTAIRDDRLEDAGAAYQMALADPALDQLPSARTEVLSNYGALLLHQASLITGEPEALPSLDQAIELLMRARAHYRRGEGEGSVVTTNTNLAMAFYQRYRVTGQPADLMDAHITLDGTEAVAGAGDTSVLDWVRSIRDMLIEDADRRQHPR